MITVKEFINKYYGKHSTICFYNPELEKYREIKIKEIKDRVGKYISSGIWYGNPIFWIPARGSGRSLIERWYRINAIY